MSFDTRNNSALMKRAEQVRRWEESDTNLEPPVPKNEKGRKIKFSSGCVFLAACVAGDKDEVLRLLETGADINTANVDGLTALHQACIDDNLDMVEFLIEHGADINRQDNEGWTPLHATASCGFVSIARYLIENGADLTAINSDGELAFDLATTDSMADYLQSVIDEYGIDCDQARQQEEQLMLNDAKKWLRSDASEADKPHPKTGATALHVAAAKGYTKVLSLLLAGRANVDKQDNDGWTPLHAAAHWGQKEVAEMLVDALADMDIRNYAGQTAIDVADKKILRFLEELKANNKRSKRRPSSQIRTSDTYENHLPALTRLIRVEVKQDTNKEQTNEDAFNSLERIMESEETDSDLTDSTESSHSTSISDEGLVDETAKSPSDPANAVPSESGDEDAPWRRSTSVRSRHQIETPPKQPVPEKETKSSDTEVILRRTQSFENDEKFYQKYNELRARIKANSCPILPATQSTGVLGTVNTPNSCYSVQRSFSLRDNRHLRKPVSPPVSPSAPTATPNTTQVRSNSETDLRENNKIVDTNNAERKNEAKNNESNSFRSKIPSPGTLFKNFFKSFVPPVRDEESETQRKAHAKRVRETRRSTQGVTLDEIKSAEELVKKKNLNNNNNSSNDTQNPPSSSTTSTILPSTTSTTTTTTATTTITPSPTTAPTITTHTPTLKITVNDRIISNTTDDIVNDTTSTDQQSSPHREICEEVSASYTIPAPLSSKFRDPSSSDDINYSNSKIISGTCLITPSTPPTTTTITATITQSISTSSVEQKGSEDENNSEALTSTSATVNVPISSTLYDKTDDLEELTKTASPTISVAVSGGVNLRGEKSLQEEELESTTADTIPFETRESIRIREKRSLFDIDNANSLTLAEKLRNEANKYSETSKSNNELVVTDDADKENLNRKNDSAPSSPLHQTSSSSSSSSSSLSTTTSASERRPSWRLKFDSGSKFKLEDASSGANYPNNNSTIITSAPAVIAAANLSSTVQKRNNSTYNTPAQSYKPVSSTATTDNTENSSDNSKDIASEVTVTLRRSRTSEDKENDKENDGRNVQAAQAVIQRRRKPKRRSTGVVHLDMDEIDPEKQDSSGDTEDKESGSERTGRSRVGSTTSLNDNTEQDKSNSKDTENGEVVDYKALWEASQLENERLRRELKKKDDELTNAKAAVEKVTNTAQKNSLSESDRRERRAMERKLSEMEEELKHLDILKTENQRLKEENGALIRVISKLSK